MPAHYAHPDGGVSMFPPSASPEVKQPAKRKARKAKAQKEEPPVADKSDSPPVD